MSTPGHVPDSALTVRLGVTGHLGDMDFPTVLKTLQAAYTLLDRAAHRIVGDRADGLRWQLSGLREGSAMTLVEAAPTADVTAGELRDIIGSYETDLREPARRLPTEDLALLRTTLEALRDTNSGALYVRRESEPPSRALRLNPVDVLPTIAAPSRSRQRTIGSVVGQLDSVNVHGKREASLWSELDRRRVVVTFPESTWNQVHAAMRRRVEVFGVVTEDADGRPERIRLQELEVLPGDDELPTLASIFGTVDLPEGMSPAEYLEQVREGFGLA